MATYNVHFLARDGRIIQKKVINAVRNYEAVQIAARLYETARDQFWGYEIWRGSRKIAASFEHGESE